MSVSQCGKCGHPRFEMAPAQIANARYQFWFVQCAGCGVVIGVLDTDHISDVIGKSADGILRRVRAFEEGVAEWANKIGRAGPILIAIAEAMGVMNQDPSDRS